jgi:hypothetical protein
MAIVVKEASKTPLAIAALAKGMADSYVNWNNSEREHQQWEQEKVWTNQDRELKQSIFDELGGMGNGAFVGGQAGLLGAQSAALNGDAWDDYLIGQGGNSPEFMQKIQLAADSMMRVDPTLSLQEATDAATLQITGMIKSANDPMGLSSQQRIPSLSSVGKAPTLSTTTMAGGTPETTFTERSQTKVYANEAEFHAAAEADGIKPGDVVIIAGQKMTVN